MTKEEREEAKAYFQSRLEWKKENRYPYISAQEEKIYKTALEALNNNIDVVGKTIIPQPKTGHWIRVTDKSGHLVWECDKCGWQQRFNTNFCPDCGARMMEDCDTCKHKDEEWNSEHCNECCSYHSGFEPQERSDKE